MSTQFFNTFRTNKPLTDRNRESSIGSFSRSQQGSMANKRVKLRRLIQEKIVKKYNLLSSNEYIENEINTFIGCDNLSDKDLKLLDSRIHSILKEKGLLNNRKSSLSQSKNYASVVNNMSNTLPVEENTPKAVTPAQPNEDNQHKSETEGCNRDIKERTIMSGASHLSQMFPNPMDKNQGNKRRNDPEVPEEELIKPKKRTHRFEFEHEDDMWNAFNNVNRRLFEQEKIEEKMKDKEIKRRTKEDLDNQIKQKLLRLDDDRKKAGEYHNILVKHIDHMNLLEEQKQNRIKAKILKEKENRDKQMWDQNYRKKVEKIKMRKYENQLLNYISSEIQNDKDAAVKKKVEAIEQLKKTLEENEHNKIKKERLRLEEEEDDRKCAEEYNRILEKQEQDRVNYFKNIELKSTDFMAKMTDTVLKDLKEKNDRAEQRMNEFLKKKDEQAVEDEKNLILKRKKDKNEMKKFLDTQIEEKKKLSEFERDIDNDQARIIKMDHKLYEEYKNDEAQKVGFF